MIDLHTHTNFSDGTDTPTELVNKAMAAGITTLALTDHDSISGWNEAINALRPGLSLVPGAEISCQTTDGISVHVLGLLFDPTHSELMKTLENTRDNRHLADALVKKGIVVSRDEAFTKMLHNNSKYYVPHYSPSPEDAIKLIKAAGGVAVIAHPMASHRGRVISAETFGSIIQSGLDGIEVDHRDHTPDEKVSLINLAKEFDLVMTGSSDYHGNGKLNILGEYTTNPDQWEKLESKANARRVVSI